MRTILALLVFAVACLSDPAELEAGDLGVKKVEVSGETGEYRLAVTLLTGDRGCEHYADWWEVVNGRGELLYRRILAHSHTDEQPFTRSGGPVAIDESTKVIVRYHMNDTGYATEAMIGSATDGFEPFTLPDNFAPHLAKKAPLPDRCAF